MIDYIHERYLTWGTEKRRLIRGGDDGWPSRTMLYRLMREGVVGASSSRLVQHMPDCLSAEANEINAAVKAQSEPLQEVALVHYIVPGRAKAKAARLKIDRSVYYDRIDTLHQRTVEFLCTRQNSQNVSGDFSLQSGTFLLLGEN